MERRVDGSGQLDPEVARLHAELDAALREIADLKSKPVADDLLMLFGRVAGIAILASVVIVLIIILVRPEADISGLTKMLDTQLSIILGAVLGYIARPQGKGVST